MSKSAKGVIAALLILLPTAFLIAWKGPTLFFPILMVDLLLVVGLGLLLKG